MEFEPNNRSERLGFVLGYAVAYGLFTTVLFFALTVSKRMPDTWTILHVAAITLFIALVGTGLRRWLK